MPTPHSLLRTFVPIAALVILACTRDGPHAPDFDARQPTSAADVQSSPDTLQTMSATAAADEGGPQGTLNCQPGTIEIDVGAGLGCYYVPKGYYMPYTNYTYAFSCPLPYTTAGTGSTSSSHCNVTAPPGSYVSPETHVITPCPAGQYHPYGGDDFCIFAPAGSYVPGTGATGFIQCSSGTYSTGGAASCTPAPAGYRVSSPGSSFPTACAPGTFQPNVGQASCLLSPAGSHVPFSGATQPTLCSTGSYQPAPGAQLCILAPIGSYVEQVGASAATPCPAGSTTTAVGATSSAQCVTGDVTAPTITPSVTGVLGNNGWYVSNVTVSWTVVDQESNVTTAPCASTTISIDTPNQVVSCTAASLGGTNTKSVTIKRDATKPTLAPVVSPSAVLLNGTATADPNATDASGIASSSCAAPNTGSVGSKSVTCTATDNAGNAATAIAGYSVTHQFGGFLGLVSGDMINGAKAGQTIPLKWRLLDANGAPVTTLTSVVVTVASLVCPTGTSVDQLEEDVAGDSGLQNLGDGYYQFNWKTPKSYATSCKTMQLNLGEGITRNALFEFRK